MSAANPGLSRPIRSARPSTCAAFTVAATSASSGARWSCVQASERTSGRLSQNALPGLKSVASAISAAGVGERPGRWHRSPEEERARRQEHARDVARGERSDAVRPGRFEVIDRARAELDRERRSRRTP